MIINKGQRLKVTIEFDYEAPFYDEDPDDVFELASLEEADLDGQLDMILNGLVEDRDHTMIRVEPVLGD